MSLNKMSEKLVAAFLLPFVREFGRELGGALGGLIAGGLVGLVANEINTQTREAQMANNNSTYQNYLQAIIAQNLNSDYSLREATFYKINRLYKAQGPFADNLIIPIASRISHNWNNMPPAELKKLFNYSGLSYRIDVESISSFFAAIYRANTMQY
jgi:hypothetical protein